MIITKSKDSRRRTMRQKIDIGKKSCKRKLHEFEWKHIDPNMMELQSLRQIKETYE